MTQTDWENLCNHCGDCCEMFNSGYSCPLYDNKKHRCSNYENRKEHIPECSTITPDNVMQLYEQGVLSDRCNYVRHTRGEELIWEVEHARMTPFTSAPLKFQMHYWRNKGNL